MSSVYMGIIFLLTLLQILIWGEKVLTLCQKMHFFWQNNTFSFRNCKKKRFRLRFLKTMHILFFYKSLGQLRQHRSYFVHFQTKTKDILSFWVFLTFFSSLRWNLRIHHYFPGMVQKHYCFFVIGNLFFRDEGGGPKNRNRFVTKITAKTGYAFWTFFGKKNPAKKISNLPEFVRYFLKKVSLFCCCFLLLRIFEVKRITRILDVGA